MADKTKTKEPQKAPEPEPEFVDTLAVPAPKPDMTFEERGREMDKNLGRENRH